MIARLRVGVNVEHTVSRLNSFLIFALEDVYLAQFNPQTEVSTKRLGLDTLNQDAGSFVEIVTKYIEFRQQYIGLGIVGIGIFDIVGAFHPKVDETGCFAAIAISLGPLRKREISLTKADIQQRSIGLAGCLVLPARFGIFEHLKCLVRLAALEICHSLVVVRIWIEAGQIS